MTLPTPKVLQARAEERRPRSRAVSEAELEQPSLRTLFKLIYNSVTRLFHDPIGMILGSTFVLIMLWGFHGNLELLGVVWKGWKGPGSSPSARAPILPGVPWDQEWLSFAAGFLLLVIIPILLIKFVYRQDLRDYGLGPPRKDRWGLTALASAALLVVTLPAFYLGSKDPGMRATYPLFRGFTGSGQFVLYELGYLPFFVAIEFIFRGYLLFGLYHLKDRDAPAGVEGVRGRLVFGYYAILVSMLSYTAWHLGKPIPELWGTLVWGLVTGTIVLATGTIWNIVLIHWLLNVFLDLAIWRQW